MPDTDAATKAERRRGIAAQAGVWCGGSRTYAECRARDGAAEKPSMVSEELAESHHRRIVSERRKRKVAGRDDEAETPPAAPLPEDPDDEALHTG